MSRIKLERAFMECRALNAELVNSQEAELVWRPDFKRLAKFTQTALEALVQLSVEVEKLKKRK